MRVKLEDVCERGTSSLMQKDIVDKNGKYPVYGASGRIGSMETYQQEHQTVAVVKDGAGIGRTMLLPEKSSVIGTMQYLIPKNCIESEYLYYVVKYMHLEKYFSGATIPHIYFRDYKTEEFNLHDKTEQREIVSTLKRIEAIISNRQEQLTKLDELVKARFVEMFGDPIQNEKCWEIKSLFDLGYCKNGMNFHKGDHGVEIHCLGVGDFKDRSTIYDVKNLPYVALNESPDSDYLLQDGDIVFVRSNGNKELVGRCLAIYPENVPVTYSGFCIRYRLTSEKASVPYILRVLKADSVRKKMAGRGANIQNLNQQTLSQLAIPLPPLSLQNQFADFVAEVDKSKVEVQKALDQTQLLFDSLMQQYFG